MSVQRTINLDDLLPIEMAMIFGEYDADQQAEFFNELGSIVKAWGALGWCGQSCEITNKLDRDGEEIVEKLATHVAHKTGWRPQ